MDIKGFLEKYSIGKDDKIIIACSGGSDSIFLVHLLLDIMPKSNLIIVHFNHHLRGDESLRDERFVKDFCIEKGLRCVTSGLDIDKLAKEKKLGIEETARIERYAFLEKTRIAYDAKYILTAHHLDDSIETFMFNLIRGTRLNGLTGIEEKNGNILRPLLSFNKNHILSYLKDNNISYIEDSSNKNDDYLRNHIRLNIVPEFSKINPSYDESFLGIMEYFRELKDNMDAENENLLIDGELFLIENFKNMTPFNQKEFIAYIFKKMNSGTIGLTKGNIDEVIRFIYDKGNCTKKEIKKLNLYKKNGKIYLNINPLD